MRHGTHQLSTHVSGKFALPKSGAREAIVEDDILNSMKNHSLRTRAFTRVELVVVSATLCLLTTLFLRAQTDPLARARTHRILCMANLKEIGLAFRTWANEHNNKFPMQYGAERGGSSDAVATERPWLHFQVLSNHFATPGTLICPADDRQPAQNFSNLTLTNVSYFVGLDARENLPETPLAGDRNITNGVPPKNGVIELTDAPPAGWTETIHNQSGNIGLADGSARHLTTLGLRRQITAANDSNKRGKTRLHLPIATDGP